MYVFMMKTGEFNTVKVIVRYAVEIFAINIPLLKMVRECVINVVKNMNELDKDFEIELATALCWKNKLVNLLANYRVVKR